MKNNIENFNNLDLFLEKNFNVSFRGERKEKFYSLLHDAFTHKSMHVFHKATYDYERLEWLGDSVIDTFVTEYLFKEYNHFNEGLLTKIRSAICSNNNFNTIANKIGISQFILFGPQLNIASTKMIADIYESLVAVLYLYDHQIATNFIHQTLIANSKEIIEVVVNENKNTTIK